DGVIFHNNSHASKFGSLCRQHVVVWSWRIVDRRPRRSTSDTHHESSRRPRVLAPFTYRWDEPVAELLSAAAACPDLDLVLTGSAPDSLRRSASDNVRFTGWVSDADYQALLSSADAILCLTTRT